ncbi:hypothetical protein [Enterococcus sp. AZ109]|uniref:hypothetical protein n=1 Tax=Enterococcus sp. AZ109 TaxID=2774634 RepID=UPI003F21F519
MQGKLLHLYNRSPLFFQNLMTSTAGLKNTKERYGSFYTESLKRLEEFDAYSLEEKEAFQLMRLKEFLTYAKKNSPFYRERLQGFPLHQMDDLSWLSELPYLTKEELRTNLANIVTIDKKSSIVSHTGGTTGTPLTVYFMKADIMERMASLDHFKQEKGFLNNQMTKATFNGKPIVPLKQSKKVFWRWNAANKQMIYSSFHITEENIPYYIDSLNKVKPAAVDGFFYAIYEIAAYILRHGITLSFKPLAIFPTSETVDAFRKDIIERAFKAKLYDQYASSEGAPFVFECNERRLHLDLYSGVIENKPTSNEIVITSFTTRGTPLIRYAIGDSMVMADKDIVCKCGRTHLVETILGREKDFLFATSGARITAANVSNLFKAVPEGIIRGQIIQNSKTNFEIKIVSDENYKERYDHILLKEGIFRFGQDATITINQVKEIPREKNGKFRLLINKMQ